MSDTTKSEEEAVEYGYYFQHEGKAYELIETELYSAAKPADLPKGDPRFHWKGGKIPIDLWQGIIAFLQDGYEKTKAENLIYLYYDDTVTHEWEAWAPPQDCVGMTVRSTKDMEGYREQRKLIDINKVQMGTIHTHCSGTAFASGTDKADEDMRDGLHVTVGKLGGKKNDPIDIHCRCVFNGQQYDTHISHWLDLPPWIKKIPAKYRGKLFMEIIYDAFPKATYPEKWLENTNRPKKNAFPQWQNGAWGGHHAIQQEDLPAWSPRNTGSGFSALSERRIPPITGKDKYITPADERDIRAMGLVIDQINVEPLDMENIMDTPHKHLSEDEVQLKSLFFNTCMQRGVSKGRLYYVWRTYDIPGYLDYFDEVDEDAQSPVQSVPAKE